MKTKHIVIGSLLSVSVVVAAIAGLGPKQGKPEAPAAVRTAPPTATRLATVVSTEFATKVLVDGEVANLYSPEVSAELEGRVLTVHVEPGQRVKKGDLLVVLDAADARLLAAADQAEVARLQALSTDKESNLARLTKLVARDLVSRAEVATAQQEAQASREAVRAAQAKAALSTRNAGKAEIRAPFDGEVAAREVAPGAYLKSGDIVVSLVRAEASYLRLTVPESYAAPLHAGMPVKVSIAGGQKFDSSITSLVPQANRATRAVTAQVAIPSDVRARPGSSSRVELTLHTHNGLAVPETAVITEGTKSYVFVVTQSVAKRQDVKLGARMSGSAEVVEGVSAGDVVAQDAAFIFDGAKVAGVGQ